MNLSEFVEDENATNATQIAFNDFHYRVDWDWDRLHVLRIVMRYVSLALGIPGNILSATVWLRLHRKNSSAVFLAALAINDLVFLLSDFTIIKIRSGRWFYYCVEYLWLFTATMEPLLVLGFSVERLYLPLVGHCG